MISVISSARVRRHVKTGAAIVILLHAVAVYVFFNRVWWNSNTTNTAATPATPATPTRAQAVPVDKYPKRTDLKLLTLFTTWNTSMESDFVYNNTINVLSTFLPEVYIGLFLPEEEVNSYSAPDEWDVLPISVTACNGTPVLKNMFQDAYIHFESDFYGFVNADVLFNSGLRNTLLSLRRSIYFTRKKPLLITGRRIDLYLDDIDLKSIWTQEEVDNRMVKGLVSHGYAVDYLITNKQFPWRYIPNLVIGRPKYDNFLLYTALSRKVLVIDASVTITALHQRTKRRVKVYDECNQQILKRRKLFDKTKIDGGNIECAKFETRFGRNGRIAVLKRGHSSLGTLDKCPKT